MKPAVKLFAAILVGIAICYVALIDTLLKQVIEQEGSHLLKAKLDVAEVRFQLLPPSLTVRGIAATNPRQPWRNSFTIDALIAKPKAKSLVQHTLILENLVIENLRFNQRRETSGAIAGLTPDSTQQQTATHNTASPSDIAQQILDTLKPRLRRDIDELQNQAASVVAQWQPQRAQLINPERLNHYKQRWSALQNTAAKEKLEGFRELDNAIKTENANLINYQNRLNTDIAAIRDLQQQARFAINQQVADGKRMAAAGNKSSLAESLLAEKIKFFADNLLQWLISANSTGQQNTAPSIWPVYIKRIAMNGYLDFGNEPLPFDGSFRYVYYGMKKIKHVTKFTIKSTQPKNGNLFFSGIIDQRKRKNLNCYMTLELEDIPVVAVSLADSQAYKVVVGKGLMTIDGSLRLQKQQLKLAIDTGFRAAQLNIETNTSGSSNAIESINAETATLTDSLRTIDRFNIRLTAKGNVQKPAIDISSSLDQLLKTSTDEQRAANAEQLVPQLTAELNLASSDSINSLMAMQQELEMLAADLNAYQKELNYLLAPF